MNSIKQRQEQKIKDQRDFKAGNVMLISLKKVGK